MELLHSIPTTEIKNKIQTQKRSEKSFDTSSLIANSLMLIKHGEHKLAANLLRQALNVDPFNKVALKELAVCFRKMKRTEEDV
jgi:thioredoxin-like negative regulator of GroEL